MISVALEVKDPSLETICLMRVLYYLNMNWGSLYEVNLSKHAHSCFFEYFIKYLSVFAIVTLLIYIIGHGIACWIYIITI